MESALCEPVRDIQSYFNATPLIHLATSFVDRDMFMRYHGGGPGHLDPRTRFDSQPTGLETDLGMEEVEVEEAEVASGGTVAVEEGDGDDDDDDDFDEIFEPGSEDESTESGADESSSEDSDSEESGSDSEGSDSDECD